MVGMSKLEFGGMLNGTPSGVFVGNGFIRSATLDYYRGSLDDIFKANFWRFTIYPADSETITFGMHECIPYEKSVSRSKYYRENDTGLCIGVTMITDPGAKLPAGAPRKFQLVEQNRYTHFHKPLV